MREPARLLVIGHWAAEAGLTRVVARLALEVQPHFEVRILGLAPRYGMPVVPPGSADLYEVSQRGLRLGMAPSLLARHMDEFRPRDVLVSGSAFMAAPLLKVLQPHRRASRVVLYLPVEGKLVDPELLRLLELVDTCVLYTEIARCGVAELVRKSGRRIAPPTFVLGHGLDTELFAPAPGCVPGDIAAAGRRAVRERLFQAHPELCDAFLVLNSNRAYWRKRRDLTITGFAQFARAAVDAPVSQRVPPRTRHPGRARGRHPGVGCVRTGARQPTQPGWRPAARPDPEPPV